jgi:hypothetical protein
MVQAERRVQPRLGGLPLGDSRGIPMVPFGGSSRWASTRRWVTRPHPVLGTLGSHDSRGNQDTDEDEDGTSKFGAPLLD